MLKNKVLYYLNQNKGEVVAGGELAKMFGVSRTSIWKTINALKEDGNQIESIPNIGYKLLLTNDTLIEQVIVDNLSTDFVGCSFTILPTINSTNQYLKEQDIDMLPNGFVVIADEQLSGKGRRGRPFISKKGQGIYLSILLKLDKLQQDTRIFTICAAVAVSRAIEKVCNKKADIKWVNDIFIDGKKVCGILTEAVLSAELQECSTIILGLGINTGEIVDELKDIATSINKATGLVGIRNLLIAQVLNEFEKVYADYLKNKKTEILDYYQSRLFIIGNKVLVNNLNEQYKATVLKIDDNGALVVKTELSEIKNISYGEIQLL